MPTHKPNAAELAEVRKTLVSVITSFEATKVFAGKGASADAKKSRKLQNNLIVAYKASLKAVDDGDYTKAKEHADAAVKAVESAGGIIPATKVGAHGDGATVIYTSDGAKANHRGTLHIAAKIGGLSGKKAPPANKEKDKAPPAKTATPKLTLRKGQVSFQPKGSGEPVAAYSVPSTLHLVVIAVKAKGHRGWKIYHAPTGEHLGSTDRGTLKDTLESVDRLGKVGDWGSLETIQETVPLELRRAAFKGDINSKATAKETATALVKQGIPPADKEATQGEKAKDSGESNYPTPKTRKDQTVAHIAVGSERIPIAAYTISSSPHLVVHRSITGAKDGDVKTGDSWVVSSKKDGLQVARYPGTLKGTKRFAEAIGKKGNWEDAETAKETVPKDTLEIINRFLKPSIFTGSGQGYDPEKELNETIKKVRASGNGDPDSSNDDEDEPVHGPSKPKVKKPYKLEKGGKIRVGGSLGKLYPDPFGRVERLPTQEAKETASPWRVYEPGDNGRPYAFGATKEEAIENAIRHAIGDKNFDRETFAVANIPDIKTLDPTDQRKTTEVAGKTGTASGEPPTWAKLRTDGYGEILDDVGPPPEFGRQGENTKPPLKRDVEDLEASFKRDRLISDVLGIKPEDIPNLSRTGAKEANEYIGSVNLAIFNDQYRRSDRLKAERDAHLISKENKEKEAAEIEGGAAGEAPEAKTDKEATQEEKGEGSDKVTPSLHKGQELIHIDYLLDGGKKRKIPIAAYPVESTPHLVVHRGLAVTKDGDDYDIKVESDGWVITQKDTGLKIASSYKGTLKGGRELAEEIGKRVDWKDQKTAQDTIPEEVTAALGGLARGQDAGNLDKAIERVKKIEVKEAAGKEPEDKPADAVGQAEEVSEKETPKAKTGKDGYITLSGKLFGRAKKSNPKGNPTPWTVEVYRGTQREYVKGRTREEAVNEALKQWRDVPVLYQGHKGPGVGILKTDAPDRRDGDKDTVVAERKPRVSEKHPKSPIKLSDYGGLQDAIQDYKQTATVPKTKKPSAEKMMGYRSAKKKSHYTPRAGRGGSEMKAAKK